MKAYRLKKIIEAIFVDASQARSIYLKEYIPSKDKYNKLVQQLKKRSDSYVTLATNNMEAKNKQLMLQIVVILLLAALVVGFTIHLMTKRIIDSANNKKTIIDSLHEGLFYFDSQGRISDERSRSVSALLPGSEKIIDLKHLFHVYNQKDPKEVQACLELLWPEDDSFFSDFTTSVTMLPKKIVHSIAGEEKILELEYKAINDREGKLLNILVIISDISDVIHAHDEAVALTERVSRISMAVSNLEAYRSFLEEAIELFKKSDKAVSKLTKEEVPGIKNSLHTLKGILSTFEYIRLASEVHQLETSVENYAKNDCEGNFVKAEETMGHCQGSLEI